MTAVEQIGFALKHVENQTNTICMTAVQQNGMALRFVENKTDTIRMTAIKQNESALRYVLFALVEHESKNQMGLYCGVVQQNGLALRCVLPENQTYAVCISAVRQNGLALQHVKNQTKTICTMVCENKKLASVYVRDRMVNSVFNYF